MSEARSSTTLARVVKAACLLALLACGAPPAGKEAAPAEAPAVDPKAPGAGKGAPAKAPEDAPQPPPEPFIPDDVDDGNLTVEGKARDDTTTLDIKAPEGWRVVTPPSEPDPLKGKFRLRDAIAGLPKRSIGPLVASLQTSEGAIHCELFERKAPVPVAQFVGLARGLRPVWNGGKKVWEKRNYYDGTIFHRVIPGYMIQGGDPAGNGSGLLGYTFDTGATKSKLAHDRPGQLCMAAGRDLSNHAQFFITETPAPQLDGSYAVFGQCASASMPVVYRIGRSTTSGKPHFRPLRAVALEKVEIRRHAGGADALAAGEGEVGKLPQNTMPGVVPPGRAVVDPGK